MARGSLRLLGGSAWQGRSHRGGPVERSLFLVDLNAFSDFWRGFTLIHMQLAQINLHLLSLLKHSEGLMLDNS